MRRGRTVQRNPAGNDVRPAQPGAVRSAVMSCTKRGWLAIAAVAVVGAGAQLTPATALADPDTAPAEPQTEIQPVSRRSVEAQHHLPGTRGRDIPGSGGRVQDQTTRTSTANSRRCCRAYVRGQHGSRRPEAGGHGGVHPVAVRIEPALRDPGRRPDRRPGRPVHRAAIVPRPRTTPLYGVLQCGAPLDTPVAGQTPTGTDPAAPAPAAPAEAPRSPAA